MEDRISRCLAKHPDWTTKRVCKSTGATADVVNAARRAMPGAPDAPPPAAPATISLAAVRERFDIAAAIKRELARLGRGKILPEEDLCRLTAGKDRNRFRRALDNNPELVKVHRIKMRLDDSSADGKFYWGGAAEIAEARKLYEG